MHLKLTCSTSLIRNSLALARSTSEPTHDPRPSLTKSCKYTVNLSGLPELDEAELGGLDEAEIDERWRSNRRGHLALLWEAHVRIFKFLADERKRFRSIVS